MREFFEKAAMQNHPLRVLQSFIDREIANEKAKKYDEMRFVGYVLEIGFDIVTIITSDPFKIAVGGIPRNSLLIMVPSVADSLPPHFTLLRVLESAPTPLTKEVQQTYFELQKKSMPELDIFTQSELQWGALKTGILGMFYPHPEQPDVVEFSGDLNNFVSAHKYRLYAADDQLLDLIINYAVPEKNRFIIGKLRLTECRLPLPGKSLPDVGVHVSTGDFMGARTAMFGKTRLGKSNVVKLIAQSLIETTETERTVGQLIFDINGEYANDNPQDDSRSLRSGYPERCHVYAITQKPDTESSPLKLNFYEHPDRSIAVLRTLLAQASRSSIYVDRFTSVEMPSFESIEGLRPNERLRAERRILMYWAVLKKAGFSIDEATLRGRLRFNPRYRQDTRDAIYEGRNVPIVNNLDALVSEYEAIADFIRSRSSNDPALLSGRRKPLFESDEQAILGFLKPPAGAGPAMIQSFGMYHDPNAGDFTREIIDFIDNGDSVILDLGNANPAVMEYFSYELSTAIFNHQVEKFTANDLGNHYVQLYFEEAHNLFPAKEERDDIYRRIAKEGAKYHLGMVYSTQSVSSISKDLLAQTENFFIAHMSSRDEVNSLARVNVAYDNLKDDILQAKTVGYIRMLTRSHRFVVPVQVVKFTPPETPTKD